MCPRGCRASLGASSATLYVWGDGTLIRIEEEKDWSSVHGLHASVFERPAEADRADALREQAIPVVSLVAEDRGTVVGHIMFSPVSLTAHSGLKIMGLAPMAVAHGQQRKGIGSALVRAGFERCRQLGLGAAVASGHIGYYPRFGFWPLTRFGIGCEYEVPEEAFMAVELQPGYLQDKSGTIQYDAAFRNVCALGLPDGLQTGRYAGLFTLNLHLRSLVFRVSSTGLDLASRQDTSQ